MLTRRRAESLTPAAAAILVDDLYLGVADFSSCAIPACRSPNDRISGGVAVRVSPAGESERAQCGRFEYDRAKQATD
jgi:hypothetical protein